MESDYAIAAVKLQSELSTISTNKTVDAGKFIYSYATLDHTLDILRPLLHANGFSLLHNASWTESGTLCLTTKLVHTTGVYETSTLPLRVGTDPRSLGSEISYMKRYNIGLLLNLAFEEEDDDGQSAGGTPQQPRKAPQKKAKKKKPVSDDLFRQKRLWQAVGSAAKSIGKSKSEGEVMLREMMIAQYGEEMTSTAMLSAQQDYEIRMDLWMIEKENTHPDDFDEKFKPKPPQEKNGA